MSDDMAQHIKDVADVRAAVHRLWNMPGNPAKREQIDAALDAVFVQRDRAMFERGAKWFIRIDWDAPSDEVRIERAWQSEQERQGVGAE